MFGSFIYFSFYACSQLAIGWDALEFPENSLCTEDSTADLLIPIDTSKCSGVDGISAKNAQMHVLPIALQAESQIPIIYPMEWKHTRIVLSSLIV